MSLETFEDQLSIYGLFKGIKRGYVSQYMGVTSDISEANWGGWDTFIQTKGEAPFPTFVIFIEK